MTALDQAFIKAFGRQEKAPPGVSPSKLMKTKEVENLVLPKLPARGVSTSNLPSLSAALADRNKTAGTASGKNIKDTDTTGEAFQPRNDRKSQLSGFELSSTSVAASATIPLDIFNVSVDTLMSRPVDLEKTSIEGVASPDLSSVACSDAPTIAVAEIKASETAHSTAERAMTEELLSAIARQDKTRSTVSLDAGTELAKTEKPLAGNVCVADKVAPVEKINIEAEVCQHPALSDSQTALVKDAELQPAWQVEHFTWPITCRRLMTRAADELDRLVSAILSCEPKKKALAIAGLHSGEGATTILLCAARRLAQRGVSVAIVDADFTHPRLARRLGVQPQLGWDEALVQKSKTLSQALVASTAEKLTLLPLREQNEEHLQPPKKASLLSSCSATLRSQFDVVLIDLGALETWRSACDLDVLSDGLDSLILVYDSSISSEAEIREAERQLAVAGIVMAGIVENFAVEN